MKTLRTYPVALLWVCVPLLFGTAIIAGFFPKFMHYLFYLNIIFILTGIALLFMPLKNFHQSQQASGLSYSLAFIKISVLEFFLVLIMVNIFIVFTKFTPTAPTMSVSSLLNVQISHLIDWGLFPWSAIILMGLVLTYYRKTLRRNISLLEAAEPVFGNPLKQASGAGVELFLRQGLIASAAVIATVLGVSLYFYAISLGLPKIPFYPNGYTVIIYLLFFIAISNRYWNWIIKKFWRNGFSTLQLCWLQTFFIILMMLIFTPLLNLFAKNINVDLSQVFFFPMPHLNIIYASELFSWSLWMALIVFIAPIIANIAKGKNLRIIFIFGLFWPFLAACLWLSPNSKPMIDKLFSVFDIPAIGLSINIIVTVALSIYFWCNKSFQALLLQSYYGHLPNSDNLSKKEKSRIPIKTLVKLLRLMALFLLLYIFDKINLFSLFFFGLVSTCYIIYASAGVCLLKSLWMARQKHDKTLID